MTAFMITMFVLNLIGTGGYMSDIANKNFPYQHEKTYGGAWANLLVNAGFAIWAGVLLLG